MLGYMLQNRIRIEIVTFKALNLNKSEFHLTEQADCIIYVASLYTTDVKGIIFTKYTEILLSQNETFAKLAKRDTHSL